MIAKQGAYLEAAWALTLQIKPATASVCRRYLPQLQHRAPFRPEKLAPAAKLSKVRTPLRPNEALLAPLSADRDLLPNGRAIHALALTYKFTAAEAGKHTVTLPLLNRQHLRFLCCTIGFLTPDMCRTRIRARHSHCAVLHT